MFGVLKSGIKLGIGCFVAIVLFIALIAGAIWWYLSDSKPAPRNRNRNGRRALLVQPPPPALMLPARVKSKRYAVANPGFFALGEQKTHYVPSAQRVTDGRVHLHAVEDYEAAQPLREVYI